MARPKANADVNGILVVDKPGLPRQEAPGRDDAGHETDAPQLLTSHDVVQRVRRWSRQRRIGHTGTLDPAASGVLVLCLGRATRLVEYYQGHSKRYLATIKLGTATDSFDATGAVTATAQVPALDAPSIQAVLAQFGGEIWQTPPVYSALKRGGEALYSRARRGETVEIEARPVAIHSLEMVEWQPPSRLVLRVHCSAGTYIRSLAADLGQALGTLAHLAALRREAAGHFTLDDAYTLAEVEAAAAEFEFDSLLLPTGTGLDLPVLSVDNESMRRLGHGQRVPVAPAALQGAVSHAEGLAVAQAPDGTCAGIVRAVDTVDTADPVTVWKAEKWLAAT